MWGLRAVILLAILILVPIAFQNFNPLPQDFIAYWAVGRLSATGGNPYSPAEMLAVQRNAGWLDQRPLMVWYPPWVMPLFIPFGILPFKLGWLGWFAINFGLILYCADWFWRQYNGPRKLRWLAGLSSLLTSYTLFNLTYTQATPWMLFGLVLFLKAVSSPISGRGMATWRWYGLLGCGLLCISIKPQALYLFWILLGAWALGKKRFALLVTSIGSFFAAAALATAINPSIWGQYLTLLLEYPPDFWATPTLGFLLRQIFGWEKFWIQFPGILLGLGWAAWLWKDRRQDWRWNQALPLILLVSLMTAAHIWTHDQVLLIPAQMAVTARLVQTGWSRMATLIALAWVGLNLVSFGMHFFFSDAWFFWQAPAIAGLYLLGMKIAQFPEPVSNPA